MLLQNVRDEPQVQWHHVPKQCKLMVYDNTLFLVLCYSYCACSYNQYIIQHVHSMIHHLWHISTPTYFGTKWNPSLLCGGWIQLHRSWSCTIWRALIQIHTTCKVYDTRRCSVLLFVFSTSAHHTKKL